ncbi:MAG: hypothetical protein ABJF88_06440 [Rhodothermales bacterium]
MRFAVSALLLSLAVLATGCTHARLIATPDPMECVREVPPDCGYHGCRGITTVTLTNGERLRVSEIATVRPDSLSPWSDSLALWSDYSGGFAERVVPRDHIAKIRRVQRRWAFPSTTLPAAIGGSLGMWGGASIAASRNRAGEASPVGGYALIYGVGAVGALAAILVGNRIVSVRECRVERP